MFTDHGQKKTAVSQIAMLALFIIGLILASVVTVSTNKIRLTDPIPLFQSGLSVSLPKGRAWQSPYKWQFDPETNRFETLAGIRMGNKIDTMAHWTYALAAGDLSASQRLQNKLGPDPGNITEKGTITVGSLDFAWAQLSTSGRSPDTIIAAASLPSNRSLTLTIEAIAQPKVATDLFNKLIQSAKYTAPENVRQGEQFISQIRESGLHRLLLTDLGPSLDSIYRISQPEDAKLKNIRGFSVMSFDYESQQPTATVTGQGMMSISMEKGSLSEHHEFRFADSLESFSWRSQYQNGADRRPGQTALELKDFNQLTLTYLSGPRRLQGKQTELTLSPATLPELFLTSAARFLLDSQYDRIMLEILTTQGWIAPAQLSQIPPVELPTDDHPDISYGIAVDFTHGNGTPLRFYYNNDKDLILQQQLMPDTVTWIKADRKELLENVTPNQAETIRQILKPVTKI
ncbi:hypothetical protein STSP2_00404 [Anaerohalosphaera lusitana]|uniref:Uncharacterized protein n=1 Tax=Anaerohalosphaera lusitana TaxID=1936003 RepID=A0A1U9NH56_9BACT|nr:hypothetical protein [Anaerohalosphaera lusitana]AQT67261.1 hypothetical protein STSP2_00404 [Anaerohalosphaera lusitana]